MDADTCSVEIRFPIKMINEMDKSKLRVLNSCSTELWITDEELKEANEKALVVFDEFYDNIGHGEETWTEIQVGDKFFDINCWDEGIGEGYEDREGAVHCSIYPTIELDNGYRYCEGDKYLRLFTVDKTLGEE
jgi:hypothetical protein